ncbi:Peroxidase 65 [Apostasia shenzhenica]|uniref:Peroxidase n=1 Tax=Apostasia shenzhenica TaxID=1088818 RepID=A0A2H9ZZY9_9ASPA|nr:Peroxidase 65 [Apostasia shenzhenica]
MPRLHLCFPSSTLFISEEANLRRLTVATAATMVCHLSQTSLPLLFFSLLAASAALAEVNLSLDYYQASCPCAEEIISNVVTTKQINNPTTAAGMLRLFFHDCFVSGCDASVLVSSNTFNRAERDADINLSLPGDAFDAVVRAKTALELQCPGVVSCADILAVATRDLVSMLGGPFYPVRLGRRDSISSSAASVELNLPRHNASVDRIVALFVSKGFAVRELVALSGAHTVGFSHCGEYADRIFNFNNGGHLAFDPAMSPNFAQALQKACADYRKDPTIATFNDIMTPGKFDNLYYQNLLRGLGLLASDQKLAADCRTAPFVRLYAANQTAFFLDFVNAMEKLSVFGIKTGNRGEVRRRCDVFNNLSA